MNPTYARDWARKSREARRVALARSRGSKCSLCGWSKLLSVLRPYEGGLICPNCSAVWHESQMGNSRAKLLWEDINNAY